jgi:programmed cell death protein 5
MTNEIEELQKMEELKKSILTKILSKQALERLSRIKLVKPDLADQLELYLVQLYQQGKLKKVSDEELKQILETLSSKKRYKIIKK